MSELDDLLDNLDEQLHAYEPRMRWALYAGTVLGILVMGWMFYLSDAMDEMNTLKEENSKLAAQISENSPEVYRAKIAKSSAEIIAQEQHAIALENEKQAMLHQMAASQGLIFDNRHYAKILDLLLERSLKLGLKIERMESEESEKLFFGKIKIYKKLTVTGVGRFPLIADFLTFIESQKGLVQLESVKIVTDEAKPRFEAVILYMGVAL